MGEQRGLAPLLTVDLAPVTVELNLRESGARFPCKWSSVLEIYSSRARKNLVIVVDETKINKFENEFKAKLISIGFEIQGFPMQETATV